MYYQDVDRICAYAIQTLTREWCTNIDGFDGIVGFSDSDSSFVTAPMIDWAVFTLVDYSATAQYRWTAPVNVTYTGIVISVKSPHWSEGAYYWMPGQPGTLFVIDDKTGKVLLSASGFDPTFSLVSVDKKGIIYGVGAYYAAAISTK